MSYDKKWNVLSILQPDLLPVEELVEIIESRCCRAKNLRLMSKEGLVGLFRRVVLPLPQRLYRTNRRGKMLTARRARAGLGSDRKEEGSVSGPNGRLKPPPDRSRVSGGGKGETLRTQSGDAKDRRRPCSGEPVADASGSGLPSGRKITLKRSSSITEKSSSGTPPPTEGKRQRTAIKWP